MTEPGALRISTAGLRGVVGAGLTAAHVLDFASAFGTFVGSGQSVVVGRDPRASGVMIHQGVVAALLATGLDVVDLGVVSTPIVQHAIRRHAAAGGVSIGASHNNADWNALKFFGGNATYLSTAEASELLDIYHLKDFNTVAYTGLGSLRQDDAALIAYLDQLAGAYDFEALRRLRVVVDCCSGTSGLILRRLNERHRFRLILINEQPDPVQFAHEPATNARTVNQQLAPLIEPLGADAGFLFDADSDRVAIATERGRAVSEEMILPLLADHVLPKSDAKLVITNLSSTMLLEEIAARHGGQVIRVPVGRQSAMDALATYDPDQVALAGEGTGAVMLARFRFVYDGIASMMEILSMMAEGKQPLGAILDSYPRYTMRKGAVPLVSTQIPALLMDLQQAYPDAQYDMRDGLRAAWPDRWFHVRVSQTESIVRVIVEQKDGDPGPLFDAVMDRVRRLS
jgi:phosphomannomutase